MEVDEERVEGDERERIREIRPPRPRALLHSLRDRRRLPKKKKKATPQEISDLKVKLSEASKGCVPLGPLEEDPSMLRAIEGFLVDVRDTTCLTCMHCRERKIVKPTCVILDVDNYSCDRCSKENQDHYANVRDGAIWEPSFGPVNDMSPFFHNDPIAMEEFLELSRDCCLSDIEQSLIAQHLPMMSVGFRRETPEGSH